MTYRTKFWLLPLVTIVLAGCGSDKAGSGSGNDVSASKGCITGGCHEVKASTVTGNAIGSEWKASTHYVTNVAGCTTCHGHYHTNSCGGCHGGAQLQNPQQNSLDAEARCLDCHVIGPDLSKGLDYRHIPELSPRYRQYSTPRFYSNYSATGYYTMRGTPYESKCIWCHNPHDTRVLPQHEQWAESGHGNTNSGPFARPSIDFKRRGSFGNWSESFGDGCVRCHTASGYINLVTSGMKNVSPWGLSADGVKPISYTRQTLYCNVCHDNGNGKAYGFNLRAIPALGASGGVRVHYNYSSTTGSAGLATLARARIASTIDYPDTRISNLCILCHTGRGTGDLIKQAEVLGASGGFNFRNNSRIGMHDFAGGATMFAQAGFQYYSSYRYQGSSGLQHLHEQIGAGYPGTGSRGPCVSCHMSSAKSHEYVPVTLSSTSIASTGTSSVFPSGRAFTVASIDTSICSGCHSSGEVAAAQFNGTVKSLNTEKKGYHSALRALFVWLNKKGLNSRTNADWVKASTYSWIGAPAYVAGCTPPAGGNNFFGSRNMGATFNEDFLKNDPAGYVHNDLYVKRIIYDSLDWIDDCSLNNTVDRAINDAATAALGATGTILVTPEEVTSALNYLFGVPNVIARPEGAN